MMIFLGIGLPWGIDDQDYDDYVPGETHGGLISTNGDRMVFYIIRIEPAMHWDLIGEWEHIL